MKPIKLEIENFISHIHSTLDFRLFDVALLVGSKDGNPYVSNGTGKTSIFSALRWVLTNKSRFSSKAKMVQHGKSFCRVSFEFSVGNQEYKIVRKLTKKTGITEVIFYQKLGNDWESDGLTCDTATMTNRKIAEVIKMGDDIFVNSVYFKQNDVAGFADASTIKRKEILRDILQIGIWDEYHEIAKNKQKYHKTQLEILQQRLKELGQIDSEIAEIKKIIAASSKNLHVLQKKYQDLKTIKDNKEIEISELKYNINNSFTQDIENLNKLKDKIKTSHSQTKEKLLQLRNSVKENNKKIEHTSRDMSGLEDKIKKNEHLIKQAGLSKEQEIDWSSLSQYEEELNNSRRAYDLLSQKYQEMSDIKLDGECPVCFSQIADHKDIEKKRKDRKSTLQTQIKNMKENITKLQTNYNTRKKTLEQGYNAIMNLERIDFTIAKLKNTYDEAMRSNETLQIEISNLTTNLDYLKQEYSSIKEKLENFNNISHLEDKLKQMVENIKDINIQIEETNSLILQENMKISSLNGRLEELERRKTEQNVLKEQIKTTKEEIIIYDHLQKAFGKNGIQAIIMENITEDLRNYTNHILKQICTDAIEVDFITQKQTDSGWKEQFDIRIYLNNEECDFDGLSGGEQVRVSIALRLALSQLLMRRVGSNIKFLLLDEVDQALDKQGIDALADAIINLSKSLKVLVITHNDNMKERFEHIITITKNEEGSRLEQ